MKRKDFQLYYSEHEIRNMWRERNDSYEMVIVLSELNLCSPEQMIEYLNELGLDGVPENCLGYDPNRGLLGDKEIRIQERDKVFRELYDRGLSDFVIAERSGHKRSIVQRWRTANKLPPNRVSGNLHVEDKRDAIE